MTYQEALDFIEGLAFMGKKAGLDNITYLLNLMGNPHHHLEFVHIAGTNGKGSTTAMTASVLTQAGYRTGMFISPYIICFRERIQCDGKMISEEDLLEAVGVVLPFVYQMREEGRHPTHFEVVTAVAMYYYHKIQCDLVVLEVGLGGRLDATNVINPPRVAAITSIGLDHVHILGDTHGKIAFEKCGILKKGSIAVCYPDQNPEAMQTIHKETTDKEIPLVVPDKTLAKIQKTSMAGTEIQYGGQEIHIPFIGMHQVYNFLTAAAILEQLDKQGYPIPPLALQEGIAATRFPARMELLQSAPNIIVDGAHNESGAEALSQALELVGEGKIYVIMGMLSDKDYLHSVEKIAGKAYHFTAVTPDNYRALPAQELAQAASHYCENCHVEESVTQAYERVRTLCSPQDTLLICGSLYLAAEIRKYILEK